MGNGKGNWRCPVCHDRPEDPVKVTAGDKYLCVTVEEKGKKRDEVAIVQGDEKVCCAKHVKALHIQGISA